MPVYEYDCRACGRRVRLVISYADYDRAAPLCPHCGSDNLKRRVGRVALGRPEGERLENLMDGGAFDGLDEDPRAMGRFMRKMSREMGEDLGDEFDEVAGRLASGESPESIERSMPELGAGEPEGGGAE
jgi:putative FmdB family regulatory protein